MYISRDEEEFFIDDRERDCFCQSFFKIFNKKNKKASDKPPPKLKKPKLKVCQLQNNQKINQNKSPIVAFPQVQTLFVNFQLEQLSSVHQLCEDPLLIGIIGKQTMNFPKESQIIVISKQGQINNINSIRPYSFSHIFINNGFEELTVEEVFIQKQKISFKISTMKQVEELISKWEKFVQNQYGDTLLKNILEKLFIRVSLIQNAYWITLNQRQDVDVLVREYSWKIIGLKLKEDQSLIKNLIEYINLNKLVQLSKLKNFQPYNFDKIKQKNIIRDLLSKIMPEQLFMCPSQKLFSKNSSLDNSLLYSSSEQGKNYKIIQQQQINNNNLQFCSQDIYIMPEQELEKNQQLKVIPSLNRKSYSYNVNNKQYQQYLHKRTQNLTKQLQSYL